MKAHKWGRLSSKARSGKDRNARQHFKCKLSQPRKNRNTSGSLLIVNTHFLKEENIDLNNGVITMKMILTRMWKGWLNDDTGTGVTKWGDGLAWK